MADDTSRQQQVDALRSTLDALRNPAGAVRLAVQMLAGPLRSILEVAPPAEAARVAEVLTALEHATEELTGLLAPNAQRAANSAPVIALPAAHSMEAIVGGVRTTVEERVRLPAMIDARVESGCEPAADPADLQAALVGLVENAIESMARRRPGAAPWRVELRVALETPDESMKDGGEALLVAFDVRDRGDGLPPAVMDWLADPDGASHVANDDGPGMSLQLARRVAEGAGGSLRATRVGGTTRVRLCVPHRAGGMRGR